MTQKIFVPALVLIGLLSGAAAGHFLRQDDQSETAAEGEQAGMNDHDSGAVAASHAEAGEAREYLKLPNQFVVPVVMDGRVHSLVVLSLSLEVASGNNDMVFAREPKLRDALLQLFFDHANSGGFSGSFTDAASLAVLRRSLLTVAQTVLGDIVTDVLITDIMRQDS
ncbi:flagellar basal body-associated FliL family protein [Pseudotabrizicola sp. L79]|uniref:flagellar basal body-associated FliL family protein n=1 Tax=Pseudotabrizicola sp. L79 TaxID=3118402 RepID=UPI002F940558